MPKFPERVSALERRVAGGEQDAPESAAPSRAMPEMPAPPPPPIMPATPQGLIDLGMESVSVAAAPAAGLAAVNALDLLSQLEEPSARAPPPSDPLAGLDAFVGSEQLASRVTQPAAAPVLPLQDPHTWLHKLTTSDSGVLYEDPYLQCGVKSEYRGWQGRLTLFLGNKYAAQLCSLRAELHHVDGLRLEMSPLPALVGERQQVTVQLAAACTSVFAAPPSLSFAYTLADTRQEVCFEVALPIFVTKFLTPAPPLEKSRFYEAWRALTGAQKLESILQVKPALASLPAWLALFAGLRLVVLPDVDPNPLNIFAASVLSTEASQPMCVVRLESDARSTSQFRLTVASPSAPLAAAVRACILPLCA